MRQTLLIAALVIAVLELMGIDAIGPLSAFAGDLADAGIDWLTAEVLSRLGL